MKRVILASDAESARTYYHYASDEMSSITHVIEGTEVLNHYEYDAWGNLTACEEKVQNRFRFNGQQYDTVTQQYYLRARYYNPVIGRFTQEDAYNADGLNLYAYCRNNPVYYVDPSGNICEKRANTLMDSVLSGGDLTRKERRQLEAKLRDEARNGTISDKGRDVARQMGIDVSGNETNNNHNYRHNPSDNPKVLKDAYEDPTAVYGYRPREDGSLAAFADGDWSDPAYVERARQDRIAYHERNEVDVTRIVSEMRDQGGTNEQIARAVSEYRNQSRLSSYMDDSGNVTDPSGYNQALSHCKSYEDLIKGGKTDKEIIESATRGNPAMDACTGLYDDYYDTYS